MTIVGIVILIILILLAIYLFQRVRGLQRVLPAFHLAGAGDEGEALAIAEAHGFGRGAHLYDGIGRSCGHGGGSSGCRSHKWREAPVETRPSIRTTRLAVV